MPDQDSAYLQQVNNALCRLDFFDSQESLCVSGEQVKGICDSDVDIRRGSFISTEDEVNEDPGRHVFNKYVITAGEFSSHEMGWFEHLNILKK